MKTRNILALILSILMIVSMLPASVFALPSAVTVSDSDYQHTDTQENGIATLLETSVASVTASDASVTEYATLAEAISAASSLEGSTVTLLDNVSLSSMITVTSGKFTIDLNGKTWKCSDTALLLRGAVDVKITDNSTSGSGKIATTSYSVTIYMWGFGGTTKLEIAGGTIESNGDSVVYTGYNDATTDTYLTVSGGKLTTTGYVAISAYGENVTITGGELESTRENIYHLTGLIDLSGHSDPTGIIIYADRNTDVDVVNDYNVLLPDGYVLLDSSGNEATAYEYGVRYTVGKVNEDDWGNDDTVTEKKASVQKSDGTERFFSSLAEAISAASSFEGSTVTLLDDVNAKIAIESGKFTIDLNGKTWQSEFNTLTTKGTSDIKVIDSSSGSGKIVTTGLGGSAIAMYDSSKLEIAGGTVGGAGDDVVDGYGYGAVTMSDNGYATLAELTVSGGKLISQDTDTIYAKGNKVTVTGGELVCDSGYYNLFYMTGTIDLSGHPDPSGITIRTYMSDINDFNVSLPDGYTLFDIYGDEIVTLSNNWTYTVGKKPDTFAASVKKSDGSVTEYTSLKAAIAAASSLEGSTVMLLDDVSSGSLAAVTSGKLTIDLNGKTWECASNALDVMGTADIKIIDSSESGSGKIVSTTQYLFELFDTAKLEIAGGTFEGYYGVVTMTDTNAELTVSGGKLTSGNGYSIRADGYKVTITGGEIDGIIYDAGTVDLSGHPDPSGITIISVPDTHLSNIIIPDGYELFYLSSDGASDGEYMVVKKNVTQIEIDLGARADEANVRYAEIGGVVTAIEENDDKYIVEIGENNLLVEVVEKTAEGEFVKAQYFYVYMTAKIAIKLDMDSYMTTDGNTSIRTSNPMGMRFKSSVLTSAKSEKSEYVIDEYGFIVATEDALGETELTLDFSKYVTGVAYNKESGTDIVFDASVDEVHVFSGYVKNIPAAQYKTNLVCKTYTKLTVGGESFVVYGEAVTGNIYDTANTLLADETLDAETKEALTQIVLDYENTLGLPGDGLYPEE